MTYKSHTNYRSNGALRGRRSAPCLLLLLFLLTGSPVLHGDTTGTRHGTILVFGDSLSAAYRMDQPAGWVALLEDRITAGELPYRVINASVSGETTSGGLARLPAVLADYRPDIVILELGGNDGLRGIPVPAIRGNLLAMVDLIEQSGATTILAGIQIPPNYGPRYTEPFTDQYADIARERDLVLVPFLLEGIPENQDLMQNDGIHPTAEAQPIVLDNVWPYLESVLAGTSGNREATE